MLGVMARRACASLLIAAPDPTYPPGRLEAVRIGRTQDAPSLANHIFRRDDGTRRATFTPPLQAGTSVIQQPDSQRIAARTWLLYQISDGTLVFTADYVTTPTNIRVPTPAEDPDGNFRRVYDITIESWLVTVSGDVVTKQSKTGEQKFMGGTRGSNVPAPNDTLIRKSQTGFKVLTALYINGDSVQGAGQGSGPAVDYASTYPAAQVTGSVGGFDLRITYPGTGDLARGRDAGDVYVTNGTVVPITSKFGGAFTSMGRPVTLEEAPLGSEHTF